MPRKYLGLSSEEAAHKLEEFGLNLIPDSSKKTLTKKIIKNLISPISLMLIVASLLSYLTGKKFDSYFIIFLLIINLIITLWQEWKADEAVENLNERIQQKYLVYRDKDWRYIDSTELVVGDVIKIKYGEVAPADGKFLEVGNVTVNESSLTGESLPVNKKEGDSLYSGTFLATGNSVVRITATGKNTKIGKTIFSVNRVKKQSLLERDIIKISEFLAILSVFFVIVLTIFFVLKGEGFFDILTANLSIIIAGIPISMPTVMTLITEFGVLNMAKKNVVVRRISSLEDLSNVNYLLTDKTGTLTKNEIQINDIYSCNGFEDKDVFMFASFVAKLFEEDPINKAIIKKASSENINCSAPEVISFIPADSNRKRSTATLNLGNREVVVSIGAPQIIESLCSIDKNKRLRFDKKVKKYAESGNRTLAISINVNSREEKNMQIVGLLSLSDAVRPEAGSVIRYLEENGIPSTMVTGDNRAIAQEIVREVGLDGGKVVTKQELDSMDLSNIDSSFFLNTGAFAEILPEDKLNIVQSAKRFFKVLSNGDGVNDLPAIKASDVGIAVSNAVSALKASADIVLLSEGIDVIKDAIVESRKIFQRIYTYSLYRVSESFRLVISIAVLGITYKEFPLTPLQIIVLALLNDLPIISLAFDRVKITQSPALLNFKKQVLSSSAFGVVGIMNSMLLLVLSTRILHLDWSVIQTLFFLKLTVSGHMLIFVAHTKEKWFKFLPSKEVIISTLSTQVIATCLAATGFLMPSKIGVSLIVFAWFWAFLWMQVGELVKAICLKCRGAV